MKIKKEYLILGIIFLVGVFLRFFQLGKNPVSMYWDEVAIALDAYVLNETGRDMNNHHWFQPVFGSYGDFKAPVFIWLATLGVRFFGLNAFAIRLPIAIFSCFLIILVYFLTKEILSLDKKFERKNKYTAFLTSFIIAISPWSVHFGRIGLESSLSVFWFLLSIYLFIKGVRGKSWQIIISIIFAGIGIYTYYSLRVVIPLVFFFLGLIFLKNLWKKKGVTIFAIILFLLINIPIYKSPYYERSQQYRLNGDNLIRATKVIEKSSEYLERYDSNLFSRIVYHRYIFWIIDFAKNYFAHFGLDFLFFSGDHNLRQHTGYGGEFLPILLLVYFLGFYFMVKNIKSRSVKIFLTLALISPIPAAMVYEIPHCSRSVYLFYPLSFVIACGINRLSNFKKLKYVKWGLFFGFIINLTLFYGDYFVDYPKRSAEDWLYPYMQISEYIKENHEKFSEIMVDDTYWMPDLYLYYQFPEILIEQQEPKETLLDDSKNSFGLPKATDYIIDKNVGEKARFIYWENEIPENFEVEKVFYLPDGKENMKLIIEK